MKAFAKLDTLIEKQMTVWLNAMIADRPRVWIISELSELIVLYQVLFLMLLYSPLWKPFGIISDYQFESYFHSTSYLE